MWIRQILPGRDEFAVFPLERDGVNGAEAANSREEGGYWLVHLHNRTQEHLCCFQSSPSLNVLAEL